MDPAISTIAHDGVLAEYGPSGDLVGHYSIATTDGGTVIKSIELTERNTYLVGVTTPADDFDVDPDEPEILTDGENTENNIYLLEFNP